MKIDKSKYTTITWKPNKFKGLVDNDEHLIRAFVSENKILYVVRDLDRLRGCKSNASNTTERYLQKDYWKNDWIKLRKKDCIGTPFQHGFRGAHMVLVDDKLANHIMEHSNKKEKETALKIFRNGIQQKARSKQEDIKRILLGE